MRRILAQIYALVDPRSGTIRYVGKANDVQERLGRHLRDRRKYPVYNWIRSLRRQGLLPELVLLEETTDWCNAECTWIEMFREAGYPLLNVADGGQGGYKNVRGWTMSAEGRANISAALKGRDLGPEWRANVRQSSLGRVLSPETKAKIARARTGQRHSAETRQKIKDSWERRRACA